MSEIESVHALHQLVLDLCGRQVVPNLGIYRLDFTGDVTVFSDHGDYTFQLLGTEARDPIDGDNFAVIINVKFLKPTKLLFYAE